MILLYLIYFRFLAQSISSALALFILFLILHFAFCILHSEGFEPSKLNSISFQSEFGVYTSLCIDQVWSAFALFILRKEVIQPHLPIRLPCYDFTLIINPTFGGVLLAVRLPTSGVTDSHGVTGGVYKARERIHRGMLIRDY